MVIWIIGLSGAGKTTLANAVIKKVCEKQKNVVLIDGDIIREIFGNDLGYSLEDRRRNADRISRLCKLLDDQGIHVVCAILSLFSESQLWNRKNIANYYEIFIDASIEELIRRDSEGIYRKFLSGEISNVPGMDIDFVPPQHADIVIRNNSSNSVLVDHAEAISNLITAADR
jgi:adenylylsulfate kinase